MSSTTNSLPSTPRSLTRDAVLQAYTLIEPHIHETPLLTNTTLSNLCSSPLPGSQKPFPKITLYLKCENFQKVGAFKFRGATHSLLHLLNGTSSLPGPLPTPSTLRSAGVITHSSGNHAQALALAAREMDIPATIVMPTISTPAKIAATKGYGARVVFSGSTAAEREAVVEGLMKERAGVVLVPPYDAVDVVLGQGTMGLEIQKQFSQLHSRAEPVEKLDAVIAPVGGGGMLTGLALSFEGTGTRVFGAEPSFQGADDCKRGLEAEPPTRVEHVSSLTIADGVRTPVGKIPWSIISNPDLVKGVFSVTEEQILQAMRLIWERVKIVVEPTAALGVAVALFDEEFRDMIVRECEREEKDSWNLGVVISGGNVDLNAAGEMLARGVGDWEARRGMGKIGVDGGREVEDVAG